MTSPGHGQSAAGEGTVAEINLRELLNTVRRQRWLVAGITLGVIGLAAFVTWRQQPVYESSTTLRINVEGNDIARVLNQISPTAGRQGVIETEMIVLSSRQIAEAVADSLSLHVQVSE